MFTRHAGVTFRGPTFFVSLLSLLGEENTFGIVCSRSSPGKIPLLTLNALSLSLFSYSSLVWEDDRGETTLRFVIAIKFFLLRMILFSMTIISVKGNECVCVLYNKRNFAFHVEIFCGLEIFLEKKNLVCKILIKKATMFPRVFENIKFYL